VPVRIALVGDESSHPSHRELDAVRHRLGDDVTADWVPTDSPAARDLSAYDGIWLVPGSPYRDDDTAYAAVRWAREHRVPFLGVCGGLQYAVVEYVRNVLGDGTSSHAESDGDDASNVVVPLACSLQGEQRVVTPVAGSRFAGLVDAPFVGMHYCGYGPTGSVVERLVAHGMLVGATAPDAPVEVLELPTHPFYVLSLFQPHIGASRGEPVHPLLLDFVRAAREYAEHREVASVSP
jgi:CTP synthase (UTP-ammonia lyase)